MVGFTEELCKLLRPLGVYDMECGTFQLGELQAAGGALDEQESVLEAGIVEASPLTASEEGLQRWERLMEVIPAVETLEERRATCAELLRIGDDSFTPADIRRLLETWGVVVTLTEDGNQHIGVHFGAFRGIPEEIGKIQTVLERVLPCHLGIDYCYLWLIWDEFELLTWDEAGTMTWNELIVYDPNAEE